METIYLMDLHRSRTKLKASVETRLKWITKEVIVKGDKKGRKRGKRDMVSNQTLMKIASLGGFVTASTGYAFHYRIQYDIKESETYKDVMNTLCAHKKAVPYLGEPITLGRITYGDGHRTLEHKDTKVIQNYKWFKVPLTGTNTKGKLYYEVTLNNKFEKSEASKIEIMFDNIPGKTFIIRQYEIN